MKSQSEQSKRVKTLRDELSRQNLSGFIIPHADEYQNEYTPDSAERLRWLTGFTGSAGTAVILGDQGAIFVDGRYVLQVKTQVPSDCFVSYHSAETSLTEWLGCALKPGTHLGYDPWLHTIHEVDEFRRICEKANAQLLPCQTNPVDAVWTDRPSVPLTGMVPHALSFAGKDSTEKRRELAAKLKDDQIAVAILTAPDSLAWLLNIRGNDVAYTPLSLCMGILCHDGSVKLFVEQQKIPTLLVDHLGPAVSLHQPGFLEEELRKLGHQGIRALCDPKKTASWVVDRLRKFGASIVYGDDPCVLPKARKNQVEVQGARDAHRRDGAALCTFLSWLSQQGLNETVTEIDAVEYLDSCRRKNALWQDMSFPTISGAGANGAIVHYRATPESNAQLTPGSLYLVDSGAQYLDGTTDVTRTVAIGTPTAEHRDRYTRVLKGHVALATARFPKGTTGSQLDALARKPLWDAGLDYDHGTGHGVGSYLGVHEGPQRISKVGGSTALELGMIVSNEPGYYKAGEYGIRIENLVLVVPCSEIDDAERELYSFETLTLVPFDHNLIDPSLLCQEEVTWINAYHRRVRESLYAVVDPATRTWLEQSTRPL